MHHYFVHNGFCGWSYGTPADPQRISADDAARLMRLAHLNDAQVACAVPAAQYAETGEPLFVATGGNRFLYFGSDAECADVDPAKVASAVAIIWDGAGDAS